MKIDGRWRIMSKLFHDMVRSTSALAGVGEPAAVVGAEHPFVGCVCSRTTITLHRY
jgi:hypothetical protein